MDATSDRNLKKHIFCSRSTKMSSPRKHFPIVHLFATPRTQFGHSKTIEKLNFDYSFLLPNETSLSKTCESTPEKLRNLRAPAVYFFSIIFSTWACTFLKNYSNSVCKRNFKNILIKLVKPNGISFLQIYARNLTCLQTQQYYLRVDT